MNDEFFLDLAAAMSPTSFVIFELFGGTLFLITGYGGQSGGDAVRGENNIKLMV
jgi:hypothetical protein